MEREKLYEQVAKKMADRIMHAKSLDQKFNIHRLTIDCTIEVLEEDKK